MDERANCSQAPRRDDVQKSSSIVVSAQSPRNFALLSLVANEICPSTERRFAFGFTGYAKLANCALVIEYQHYTVVKFNRNRPERRSATCVGVPPPEIAIHPPTVVAPPPSWRCRFVTIISGESRNSEVPQPMASARSASLYLRSGGLATKPLVRGSGGLGGEAPLKLKALLYFKAARMLFSGPISTKYTSVSCYTSL